MKEIIEKINNRKNKVGIIGLGYVGLPLTVRFSEERFNVVGFDIDAEKVKTLNMGETYIKHIDSNEIKIAVKNGFRATTGFSKIANVDAILICVPTPLGVHNEPDLSYIRGTLESIKPYLNEKLTIDKDNRIIK